MANIFGTASTHRLEGYKLPDLAPPPPELKGQLTFDLNAGVDGMETFKTLHCGQQELVDLATKPTSKPCPAGTEGMARGLATGCREIHRSAIKPQSGWLRCA